MKINFKKLSNSAITPTYAHYGDAGMDLYANESVSVNRFGVPVLVRTGIAIDIPLGYVGLIHPRSGLAKNHGISILNAPGTIDSGYTGEIQVLLYSVSGLEFIVNPGDRIAQLVIKKVEIVELEEVFEFYKSERGENGFGSTGK